MIKKMVFLKNEEDFAKKHETLNRDIFDIYIKQKDGKYIFEDKYSVEAENDFVIIALTNKLNELIDKINKIKVESEIENDKVETIKWKF